MRVRQPVNLHSLVLSVRCLYGHQTVTYMRYVILEMKEENRKERQTTIGFISYCYRRACQQALEGIGLCGGTPAALDLLYYILSAIYGRLEILI